MAPSLSIYVFLSALLVTVEGQCKPGAGSPTPMVTTHLCADEQATANRVQIHSHENYGQGATITSSSCGCKVIVPANTEVNFQSNVFTRQAAGRDPSTMVRECKSRIEVLDYDSQNALISICDAALAPNTIPCQTEEKMYYVRYTTSDTSIQSLFDVNVFASFNGQITVRCKADLKTVEVQSNSSWAETFVIVLVVIVILIIVGCCLVCCCWIRKKPAGDEVTTGESGTERKPMGRRLVTRIISTFSRATGPKILKSSPAVPVGHGIPVSIDLNTDTSCSQLQDPSRVNITTVKLMGKGDAEINPYLPIHQNIQPDNSHQDIFSPCNLLPTTGTEICTANQSTHNLLSSSATFPNQPNVDAGPASLGCTKLSSSSSFPNQPNFNAGSILLRDTSVFVGQGGPTPEPCSNNICLRNKKVACFCPTCTGQGTPCHCSACVTPAVKTGALPCSCAACRKLPDIPVLSHSMPQLQCENPAFTFGEGTLKPRESTVLGPDRAGKTQLHDMRETTYQHFVVGGPASAAQHNYSVGLTGNQITYDTGINNKAIDFKVASVNEVMHPAMRPNEIRAENIYV